MIIVIQQATAWVGGQIIQKHGYDIDIVHTCLAS